jgi:hypothetical protein
MAAFPIFVVDEDAAEVIRFDNDREMQWMEPVDVEDGVYTAFDALGRPVALQIVEVRRKFLGLIPKMVQEIVPGDVTGETNEQRARELMGKAQKR